MKDIARIGMSASEIRYCNSKIMEILSLYLNILPDAITPEIVNEISKSCNIPVREAYAQAFAAVCELNIDREDKGFFYNYILPMLTERDPREFENDPYYKNIKIPDGKTGSWELRSEVLKPCEAFVCGDLKVFPDGRMIPQIAFFMREFSYPAILENGREWMTLMPNETVTTLPAISRAHGKVLTYGCGLGYFTYMASLKDEVDSVTVVEISESAIQLFREHILPQFEHKEKVRIINKDALLYAKEDFAKERYDFVFADIWHDVSDGKELMLKLKEYEKESPDTEYTYWIEDTINCYLDKKLWEL